MTMTKGLEGIVATSSSVSSIIDGVLTYQGYNIDDLANNANFEEVIYLLWNGCLPNVQELEHLQQELRIHASIPQQIIEIMKALPLNKVHPMAALRSVISSLALYDDEADLLTEESNMRKAIRLQAQISTIIAAFSRIREGKEPIPPRKDLGIAANFLYMLTGHEPDQISINALDKALVLHADHELNASTFTARVCVATLSDLYSGVTAAIGALKGPLHGGANEAVMSMLKDIDQIENVQPYLERAFSNKQKIMGFGHRVYKDGDPRAKHLREMAKQLTAITGEHKWYEMSLLIEDIVTRQKGILPNVDFYSATVYHSLGIQHDLFTPIFAISRTSGWIAHILEQYRNNRLIRPRAEYVGPTKQIFIPIERR
ncbi:citrate synthase [Anaerobacillus sp. MEB173]|uniref:citrate synthase n=1 Tax=Anaerobacillus sp. MEB173 TaxID=3383345 RepID=UPI003F92A165